MAAIRKRGDKWQARIRIKGQAAIEKSFSNKADAEAWAKITEAEMIRGVFIKRTDAERTTLLELIDRYGREISPTKRGHDAESYRLEQFRQAKVAKQAVASITAAMIATWRDERLKAVSSGTVLRDLQLMSHVFSVAERDWGLHLPNGNPVEKIRKPAPGKARDRVLTDTEREALLLACGQCKNSWIKPVVQFALETAARRGEILSLSWRDVDLERCTAKVDGKTGARVIPLSGQCAALLKGLPRSLDGRVFPVTAETLKQAYERAVVRAGISGFNFHDLRHDALTRLAKLGLSILELRSISGHTTANMLQRYVAIDPAELARKLG